MKIIDLVSKMTEKGNVDALIKLLFKTLLMAKGIRKVAGLAIVTEAIRVMLNASGSYPFDLESIDAIVLQMLDANTAIVRSAGLRCLEFLGPYRPSLVLRSQQHILQVLESDDLTFSTQAVMLKELICSVTCFYRYHCYLSFLTLR